MTKLGLVILGFSLYTVASANSTDTGQPHRDKLNKNVTIATDAGCVLNQDDTGQNTDSIGALEAKTSYEAVMQRPTGSVSIATTAPDIGTPPAMAKFNDTCSIGTTIVSNGDAADVSAVLNPHAGETRDEHVLVDTSRGRVLRK